MRIVWTPIQRVMVATNPNYLIVGLVTSGVTAVLAMLGGRILLLEAKLLEMEKVVFA